MLLDNGHAMCQAISIVLGFEPPVMKKPEPIRQCLGSRGAFPAARALYRADFDTGSERGVIRLFGDHQHPPSEMSAANLPPHFVTGSHRWTL